MGKSKEQKTEAPGNAFSRMNYLYQAANLMTKIGDSKHNHLSNYYNKMMKEISKKVLEKLHPDLKRTVCCACNYSLTATSGHINVKVKSQKKIRKKKKSSDKQTKKQFTKDIIKRVESNRYSKSRIEARNKRPNKLQWFCYKCGFSKNYLQKPSFKLWIHETQDSV